MADKDDPIIRKTVSLPSSVWKQIEDFQFDYRVKRDAEAVRQLIERGLRDAKAEKKVKA